MKRNYKHILFPFVLCGLMAAQTSAASGIVKGRITDTQGKPVAQVVVTDGRNFTTTDAMGHYRMESDAERQPLVYISTPSAYKLPETDGIADKFYQFQKADSQENICNFMLEPRETPTRRFVYIAISDPQVKTDAHLDRFRQETVPDLKRTVDSFKGKEVVGMAVGDLVWDAMNLMEPYKESVSHLGLTMFQVIGNHDFNLKYADMERTEVPESGYGEADYHKAFGPTDYSFNIGQVHVVTMKDIDYQGGKKYKEAFTPAQLAWLKKDLSYVPKGSLVFLNLHAPTSNTTAEGSGNTSNTSELLDILKDYQVHIFAGHTHFYENAQPAANIYEHNIGAACGAWWAGHVNRCGAPNGYLIVEVDDKNVKWHYKATGKPSDYQFRIYKPGEFKSQPKQVVANIWDWDPDWKVEWFEDGKPKGLMQPFEDEDQDFITMKNGKAEGYHTRHLFRAQPSTSARTVTVKATNRFHESYTQQIEL